MSVLVVGLSHKSAPVAVLERAAVSGDTLTKLLRDVVQAEPVAEAFVVSTCNRVEVYAEVDRFHAGVTAICELLDLSDHIREMILEKRPTSEIKKAAREEGMRFLRESALDKVRLGLTTLKEINKVTFIEAMR